MHKKTIGNAFILVAATALVGLLFLLPVLPAAHAEEATTTPVGTDGTTGTTGTGDQGQTGGEDPAPAEGDGTSGLPQGEANIDTGNATSTVDVANGANTNTESVPTTASSTVSNTNEAAATTTATSGAGTGANTALGEGGAKVKTGDAVATANVINVVNTNIINSTGILAFLNAIFGGGFDLRNFDLSYFFGGPSGAPCSLQSCLSGSLNV